MNARERVLAILNREKVDRIPIDIWHTPEIGDALRKHFGAKDDFELYRMMGLDKIAWFHADYLACEKDCNLWGTKMRTFNTGTAIYTEIAEPGLKTYDTIESLDDYPYWPDIEKFDYEGMVNNSRKLSKEFVMLGPWVSFFEIYCQLRGLEQSLMDVVLNENYANAVLDRIEDIQTRMMKRMFELSGDAIDMVFISDDMGSQENLLLSPAIWDKFFRPRMKRWCDLIHSHGKKVFFHTDGAAAELIPRLIEVGIDVLNPIQHTCPGMEIKGLKEKFGKQLIFHGGVDNQKALPFGSVEDVRKETRQCLGDLGAGREGFICCSCHNIQPGTPIENIIAMVETVQKEGAI